MSREVSRNNFFYWQKDHLDKKILFFKCDIKNTIFIYRHRIILGY